MADDKVSIEALVKRLKRVEGQIRGVQKMIGESRDCESVMTQLAAVRSAIDGVGALLLVNYMESCVMDSDNDSPDTDSLARAISIWGGVHVGQKGH